MVRGELGTGERATLQTCGGEAPYDRYFLKNSTVRVQASPAAALS